MSELLFILVMGIIAYLCFSASRSPKKLTEEDMRDMLDS